MGLLWWIITPFLVQAALVYLIAVFLGVDKAEYQTAKGQTDSDPFAAVAKRDKKSQQYELAKKIVAVACGIPLLRAVFVAISMSTLGLVCKISLFGAKVERDANGFVLPLTGWRRKFRDIGMPIALRMVMFSCGVYRIKVKGALNPRASIIVGNHSSGLDPFVIGSHGVVYAIGKAELLKLPVFAAVMDTTQSLALRREDPDSRSKVMKELSHRAHQAHLWPRCCVFPEGTRTNARSLIAFKKGAFSCEAPVQPVVIRYPWKHYPVAQCSQRVKTLVYLFSLLCQVYNEAEVEFLPMYEPNEEEKTNGIKYANNVREAMAKAMSVSCTSHTLEDALLLAQAIKAKIPLNTTISEFQAGYGCRTNLRELKTLLTAFAKLDRGRKGYISLEDFVAGVGENNSQEGYSKYITLVFQLLQTDNKNGQLTFKDFVVAVYSSMSSPAASPSTDSIAALGAAATAAAGGGEDLDSLLSPLAPFSPPASQSVLSSAPISSSVAAPVKGVPPPPPQPSLPLSPPGRVQLAFQVYDQNKEGVITAQRVQEVLRHARGSSTADSNKVDELIGTDGISEKDFHSLSDFHPELLDVLPASLSWMATLSSDTKPTARRCITTSVHPEASHHHQD